MLSRKVQRTLDAMMSDPNFRVTGKGDTFFATAPGYRAKKIMYQGDATPAGQYMRDEGFVLSWNLTSSGIWSPFGWN